MHIFYRLIFIICSSRYTPQPRLNQAFLREETDRLHMNSLTKLINAAGFFQLISCRQKCRKISCQAGRFAGNIYNMVYPIRKNLRQCFGMDSIPWRIQNDHIRFLRQIIQDFKDISCNKFAITQVIQCCFAASTASSTISTPITSSATEAASWAIVPVPL